MRCTAYLLLGTNQGNRTSQLEKAESLIDGGLTRIIERSSVYETSAWGVENQAAFLNKVVQIETSLSPLDLLDQCQTIEAKMGRERIQKWGPRLIDIDIVYYENLIIEIPELSLPQKHIENRRFTLQPLAELIPDYIHPILLRTNCQLLDSCTDPLKVALFDE